MNPPDLTNVFKEWFEVAATPVDMTADAVKQWTQGHIQPFVDKAEKSLRKQEETIDSAHPGLRHSVIQNLSEFGDKIEQAADTTVDYAKLDHVPAFDLDDIPGYDYLPAADDIPGYDYLPAADDIPGVQKVKQMAGIEPKEKEKKRRQSKKMPAHKGGKRRRRRRKTKKRALKKRHRRRKRKSRRRRKH